YFSCQPRGRREWVRMSSPAIRAGLVGGRMRVSAGFVWAAVFVCVFIQGTPAWAGGGRLKAGEVKAFAAETPHPYPKGWSDRVFSPGAEFVRVHFTGLNLADGDTLTVSSPDRGQVWTYTGR